MLSFLLRADDAEVDMMRARPNGRLLEERIDQVNRPQGNVAIADLGEPLDMGPQWLN